MNEKIKEIIVKSNIDIRGHYDESGNTPQQLQEFAELIVRECVGIVEDYGLSLVGSDENYLGETLNLSIKVQEAGNKIKQHFGVDK